MLTIICFMYKQVRVLKVESINHNQNLANFLLNSLKHNKIRMVLQKKRFQIFILMRILLIIMNVYDFTQRSKCNT